MLPEDYNTLVELTLILRALPDGRGSDGRYAIGRGSHSCAAPLPSRLERLLSSENFHGFPLLLDRVLDCVSHSVGGPQVAGASMSGPSFPSRGIQPALIQSEAAAGLKSVHDKFW